MHPSCLRQQIKELKNRFSLPRNFLFILGILGLTAAATGLATYLWLYNNFYGLGPLEKDTVLIIPKGASSKKIAANLESAGVIHNANVFWFGLSYFSPRMPLRAGEFLFSAYVSPATVVDILQSSPNVARKFTAAEGLSSANIAKSLKNNSGMTGSVGRLPEEGWLLPETYNFSFGDSRRGIIRRMNKAMVKLLAELWEKRSQGLPFKSPEEALVLASIVEKETGISKERARVAAVFINRMRKGMRLQSDPTVIYGLTQGRGKLGRALTRKDLRQVTPYNTYVINRLPPTAIANPGKAALQAVLHPMKSNEFYFVADGSGGHVFSKTLKEHNVNVFRWRRLKNKNNLNKK